jgi:hypothetical protein
MSRTFRPCSVVTVDPSRSAAVQLDRSSCHEPGMVKVSRSAGRVMARSRGIKGVVISLRAHSDGIELTCQ